MCAAPRRLQVAAIQVRSDNGLIDENLARAEPLVAEAAARGAELILCPEFLAAGYVYDESIWRSGEPAGGPTERWLARLARSHGVVIGATFLEAEGDHFYNTFSLFGPDGDRLGRVRKHSLPFFEGWFFTPCSKPRVIDTPLGRLAVGICNDNQTASFLREVLELRPDLVLMPHSAPTPELPIVGPIFQRLYDAQLSRIAQRFAAALRVPVVMANKVSERPSWTSLPLLPGVKLRWRFHGYSSIYDGDGQRLAYLEDRQGALVASVTLGATKDGPTEAPSPQGYWSFAPALLPRALGKLLLRFETAGKRAYQQSERRLAAARERAASGPTSRG